MKLEKIGPVNPDMRGEQELYRRGDEYFVVSTVSEVSVDDSTGFVTRRSGAIAEAEPITNDSSPR